ncbi:hypothetical protein RHSIM_Rhsim10G0091100 [Rhododendron simsii]|uniref:Retrotransposon gag domain-containing protein n=1 Tax=Rhododendron simsii TaxID=118357 RepID=A0A834LC40_RHOSS|nr:hypothetical protein RHSIM_Rhsim10G0091100 [Rhododendron simsii]
MFVAIFRALRQNSLLSGHGRPQQALHRDTGSARWRRLLSLEGKRSRVLLDWVAIIEEILDFKRVPEDRQVALVATRFRGRAAAWWQQLKLSSSRQVDDYTTEFHQLVVRNDVAETEEQLVSRYVGGLREQYQITLNTFDLYSVSDAHQRAKYVRIRPALIRADLVWPTDNSVPVVPQANRVGASGSKCFKCEEPGHRAVERRKGDRLGKALFVDADGITS